MAPMREPTPMASRQPRAMPSSPPMAEVVPASMTNWLRMSLRLAPRDFRMPISRVRSVTDTSMMFIIPMPPTSREMAAMATSTPMTTPIMALMRLACSSMVVV